MFIKDYYRKKTPISFEVFPPKKQSALDAITGTLGEMASYHPDFVSVTYGAGGSGNSGRTTEIASMLKNQFGVEPLAHLTAVTAKKEAIEQTLLDLKSHNIQNIMALRGDVPVGFAGDPTGDFRYAKDLIAFIRNHGEFCIGAACYPEGHIDCANLEANYDHLLEKQNAGADFLVSQLFFDNDRFFEFLSRAHQKGITIPIVPGIMPILGKSQVERMIFTCGVSLPSRIIRILHQYENDPESLEKAGIEYACEQVEQLLRHGVDGVHIYSMNKPKIAKACRETYERLQG